MNSLVKPSKGYGNPFKRWISLSLSLILIMALFISTGNEVFADTSLVISTTYTGLEAKAGETIEFPLKIKNNTSTPQNIELIVSDIPENWEWSLEGRGRTINRVFVDKNSYENVDLKIEIPDDIDEGNYKVVVDGRGTLITDKLTINIDLKQTVKQDSELSAEYPDLEGTASTSFKYRVNLTNNSNKTQSYSLEANVPRGWQVSFSPAYSSENIASITVEPDKNEGIDIKIDPPNLVKAGEYTIPIIAKSADETLRQDLKVIIKGTYELLLTTPTGRLSEEAYAGREKEIKLVVINRGSGDLKDIEFSSWEPKNWEVNFEPKEIDVLKAGEEKEIKAYIKPDAKALAGDYIVELRARTPEDSSSAEFRITVKTSTIWGLTGGIILVGLIGGIYLIFNKYGRR